MRNKDVVMTLLQNLSTLYKHLNIAFVTMSMKELIMEYMFNAQNTQEEGEGTPR